MVTHMQYGWCLLLRPFSQLHHILPNKMLQKPKHSFRRSENQALGIFQNLIDMYVCMHKPIAPCKKLSASQKKPSDSWKKPSSLWWSCSRTAIKSKNHSEGQQHFKDAILSSCSCELHYCCCRAKTAVYFMVQFQGQYFEVNSGSRMAWEWGLVCKV